MNALASPKHDPLPSTNGALLDLDFFTKKPDESTNTIEPPKPPRKPASPDDVIVDISANAPSTSNVNLRHNSSDSSHLDNILDLNIALENPKCKISPSNSVESNEEKREKTKNEVKPLTDIDVTLSNVTPSDVPPMTIFEEDNGITVVLHFCKDKPRPDVNVIVISTTSKNKKPILDFRFQAVVPKVRHVNLICSMSLVFVSY